MTNLVTRMAPMSHGTRPLGGASRLNIRGARRPRRAPESIREMIAIPVWPLFAPLGEQFVASLNEQLGPERYEALAAEGAAMRTEDALSVGLE